MEIKSYPDTPDSSRQWMHELFSQYNAEHGYGEKMQPFHFEVEKDGERIGLVNGCIAHGWCKVSGLIVAPEHRGQGYAMALMKKAEGNAKDKGCLGMILNTVSYQAPEFYKKCGFEEFAEIEPYSGEHKSIYFKKVF